MSLLTQGEAREERLLEATGEWYICRNNRCRHSELVSTTAIGYPSDIFCGSCTAEMCPETSADVPVRHIKTLVQAQAKAKLRWGPDGDAWGISPLLCVGVWNHDLLEPLQTIQGKGSTWADAFNRSEGYRGHYHFCPTCNSHVGKSHLCFQNCGDVPGICEQIKAERRGEHQYKCQACAEVK